MTGQTALLVLSIATSGVGLAAVLLRTGRQFGVLETRLAGLHREVTLQFQGVDRRLDGIDARLDRMDDRFDRMDDRFDRMDDRFDRMDDRFDRMDDRFERVQAFLSAVQVDVARIGQQLDDHVEVAHASRAGQA